MTPLAVASAWTTLLGCQIGEATPLTDWSLVAACAGVAAIVITAVEVASMVAAAVLRRTRWDRAWFMSFPVLSHSAHDACHHRPRLIRGRYVTSSGRPSPVPGNSARLATL